MSITNVETPAFVPASLLRVRCFLNAEGGMKVKPWATVDETLDAFHDSLISNRDNDAFWIELRALLALLSEDLKRRVCARDGEVIDNELLNRNRQQSLLDESASQRKSTSRPCRLSTRSRPNYKAPALSDGSFS